MVGRQQRRHRQAEQHRPDQVERPRLRLAVSRPRGWLLIATRADQAIRAIIGRLIQNTQRQPSVAVSAAPSAGPMIAATPHIAAFRPNARGRSSSGTYSANSPSGTANMNPAPRPRMARANATISMLPAMPPSTLATTNRTHAMPNERATP